MASGGEIFFTLGVPEYLIQCLHAIISHFLEKFVLLD